MIRRALFLTTALIALAQPVLGQDAEFDATVRAKEAGSAAALGSGSSVFSMESVTESVTPYAGTDTTETSVDGDNIDARVNEVISGSSDAARAYQDSMDSVTLRPSYDLGTDHIGITVGDQATINAEDIAGQYFTSSTETDPACTFTDFNVLEPFERFCDVHSNLTEETCTIDRIVEVDRRDTWRCDVTTDDITVSCTPGEDGTCAIEDLPEGNPANKCTFLEERCVAWGGEMERQPQTGSYLVMDGDVPSWGVETYNSGRATDEYMWDGVEIGNSIAVPYHSTDGWTYEIDWSSGPISTAWGENYGVYRYRVVNREPATGYYYSTSAPEYYWLHDEIVLVLVWNGSTITLQGAGEVTSNTTEVAGADGCTYYRGDYKTHNFYGVYRSCAAEQTGCTQIERDYSCTTEDQCATLAATEACERTEQTCLTSGPNGCELDRSTYSCFNDLTNHAPAALLESKIERIEDKLVNSCDPSPSERGCFEGESVCTVGEEVRTIMGFPVSRECWQYSQKFTCLAEGVDSYSDCAPFENDASCEVIGQTCLSFVESDETEGATPIKCQHWEYQYRCGGNIELPEHCTAFNVCVGDLCEGMVDEANTDFANAAAWLTVLDEAAKDNEASIDMQDVTLFAGTARNCKVGALGTINCCSDSGWANDILGDCSESELALMDRIQAKAAVYVGTYCSRKVLGVCLQKRRSYCTFNSQLGMVFQKEIRRLAGTGWGSAKSPNCAGLALDEIDTIDWDQIDLSEAFVDMMNDANVPTTEMVTDYLRDRLELTAGAVSEGD